jgi:hypothetical protein
VFLEGRRVYVMSMPGWVIEEELECGVPTGWREAWAGFVDDGVVRSVRHASEFWCVLGPDEDAPSKQETDEEIARRDRRSAAMQRGTPRTQDEVRRQAVLDEVRRLAVVEDPVTRARESGELLGWYQDGVTELARMRREAVQELIDAGLSHGEIAERIDVSRSRVGQITKSGPLTEA